MSAPTGSERARRMTDRVVTLSVTNPSMGVEQAMREVYEDAVLDSQASLSSVPLDEDEQ